MSSPFAALPPELILSVLTLAAEHHPTALALSLVSSWVHKHVEPALYHTVRLPSSRALASFISTLDNKPPAFSEQAVKKLSISAVGPISSIETVLSRCTGVISLACGFSVPSYVHCARGVPLPQESVEHGEEFTKLPISPKEQHLFALACRDGLDISIISPSVTHLRIQLTSATTFPSVARLAELYHLTHLAVFYKQGLLSGLAGIQEMLRPVMEQGRLRVLLLQVAGAGEAHLEEIRKWDESEDARRRTFDEHAQRTKEPGLTIVAERAPRSILPQWEDSERFWSISRIARSTRA